MWTLILKYGAKYLLPILIIVGILWKAYSLGGDHVRAQWEQELAKQETAHALEIARLAEIGQKVEIEYVYRDKIIKEKGDVIIETVKEYITVQDDSMCDIGPGFVELHDAAAQDRVPNPETPHEFNEGTSNPKLSEVGEVVVTNYIQCNRTAEQLRALQNWAQKIGGN